MATRRRMPRRNAKGRFIKASSVRHNRHRRRRRNAAPRVRTRTRVRNVTRVRYVTKRRNTRTRRKRNQGVIPVMIASDVLHGPYSKVKGAIFGRRRKKSTRRRRRNLTMAAHRTRKRYNRRHHRHHARSHRRRRNISMGGLIPTTPMLKQILWAGAGTFVGGKITGLVWNKISPTLNLTGTADTVGRLAVGGILTAVSWGFNPMFGLGVGLGAFSTVTDYLMSTLWGIQSQYTGLTGMGRMGEYVDRQWKVESPGWGSPKLAGLSANVLQSSRFKQ